MKVLVATDGTKHGDAAINALERLRLSSGDSIHVISVVDMAVPLGIDIYSGYLPDTADIEAAAREQVAGVITAATSKLTEMFEKSGVAVTSDVLFGSPDSRIVETAEEIDAELIVVGSHGYKRWERMLLGSVSDSVVHHAHCSVLIVRDDNDQP